MYIVEFFNFIEDGAATWCFWGLFTDEKTAKEVLEKQRLDEFNNMWRHQETGGPLEAWERHKKEFAEKHRIREVKVNVLDDCDDY